jgi:Na+-transporting methylmalonyl-CoA/oxaloacetate decarboxylase beta subunit
MGQGVMLVIGLLLLYLAIARNFEPLLLVPIGFGGILANIPGAGLAFSAVEDPTDVPAAEFTVNAVYPNPFNPSTSVRMYIPQSSDLELAVYDVQGRKVRSLHTGGISSGWHTMVWDGRDDAGRGQASGMYFLRALSAGDVSVQKMTLVK